MVIRLATDVEAQDIFNTSYTVASGTQISKGTLLKLTSPRTAAKADAVTASAAVVSAGIAAFEKDSSDTSTTMTAWTKGVFKGYASGAIGVGDRLCFIKDGYLTACDDHLLSTNASKAIVVGYALEAVANNGAFVFKMDL